MKKLISLILILCIAASLIICSVSAESADSLNVAYAGNGIFNVTGTVAGDGNYKLIMADYAADGTFLGASTEELTVADGAFATTVDFSANNKQTVSTKLMVWDMTTATPVAEAVVNPKANGGVNVATVDNAIVGGTGSTNVGLLGTPSSILDGDDATWTGFYATRGTTGYIYIDLQDNYEIDRIEILSYSDNATLGNAGARGTEYDIVLGNDVPDGTAFDAENPNGEVKVAYVEFDEAAKDKNVGYKTFYVPENAGEFRYVSLEKWDPERAGLVVGEVKVYVKEENMPSYVDVAAGKFASGSTSSAGNVRLYGTDSTGYIATGVTTGYTAAFRLTDGDVTTGAGFMVSVNTMGNMYVDLGAEYKIHHIDVLSYNKDNADRADKYTVVMSNSVRNGYTSPDAEKYEFAQVTGATTSDATTAKYRRFIAPNTDKTYRFVSVEKFVSGTGLSVAEIKVYVEADDAAVTIPEYTEVANGKATGGAQIDANGNAGALMYSAANLVNGNETDNAGFYYSVFKGYEYIDLGTKYKIDHIDVIASNANRPACASDYDVVASNIVPDGKAYDAANPNGKLLVDHANYDSQMTSASNNFRRFYMPEGDNEYRFISLEKFQKNDMGMLISEVKVYVKTDEMPVLATNVALGKIGELSAGTEITSISKGTASVTDGVLSATNGEYLCSYLPAVYTLDLKSFYDIEKILIDCQYIGCTDELTVYLADAPYSTTTGLPANKTTVIKATADNWDAVTKTVTLDTPVNARYVIVHRAATNVNYTHFRLGELEVWGK